MKEEHIQLKKLVRKFAQEKLKPSAQKRDEKEFFDLALFKELGKLGLLGVTVDEKYGGSGMDALSAVLVHEELSCVDPGFCLAYLAHSMLCVNNLAQNGNEEQKMRYLPKLCSGEWVGAMAMSEPEVGTDVLGMKCSAKKTPLGFVINGRKMWITNGTVDEQKTSCDVVFLYAKTNNKISSFIVEKGQAGFSVGQKLTGKLGMRASNTAELVFEDCLIRQDQLIGSEGDSVKHMMRNLEIERITLAAMSLGIMRSSLEIMTKYANDRIAFEKPIIKLGQIQRYVGESYAKFKACKSFIYDTAKKLDGHRGNNRIDSDAVKLFASQCGKEIADNAIQVLGGYGYMSEYVVERLWRDAKLLEIGGGTIEAHQKNIANDLSKNMEKIFD